MTDTTDIKVTEKIFTDEELFGFLKEDEITLTEEEMEKAKADDGETLYHISSKYTNKDSAKRYAWIQKAAAQHYSEAEYTIGLMFAQGEDVTLNAHQAMDWFLKAANTDGNPNAQNMIGQLYRLGEAVPQDLNTAIEWFTKSANQGNCNAQTNLGAVYQEIGDSEQAIYWLTKSANQGDTYSKELLEQLMEEECYSSDEEEEEEEEGVEEDEVMPDTNRNEVKNINTSKTTYNTQYPSRYEEAEKRLKLVETKTNTINDYLQHRLSVLQSEKADLELQQKILNLEIRQVKKALEHSKDILDDAHRSV